MKEPTTSSYWTAVRDVSVWRRAARLGLIVGLVQVAINQGDHWLQRNVDAVVVAKTILSPFLSFAIAFTSAAATRVEGLQHSTLSRHE